MPRNYRPLSVCDHMLAALASGAVTYAQQLADTLGVTLNAVQQAASRLRAAGYHIASGTGHQGLWYQRCSPTDPRLYKHRHGAPPRAG